MGCPVHTAVGRLSGMNHHCLPAASRAPGRASGPSLQWPLITGSTVGQHSLEAQGSRPPCYGAASQAAPHGTGKVATSKLTPQSWLLPPKCRACEPFPAMGRARWLFGARVMGSGPQSGSGVLLLMAAVGRSLEKPELFRICLSICLHLHHPGRSPGSFPVTGSSGSTAE